MLTIRHAEDRGHANHGWLDTWHTFSFSSYYDPAHMGISNLRVINDDRIAPGGGFPTHGHEDMEIVTYVLDGALEHKDSMGNGSVIRPGEVQYMAAGTGVRHSEYNASASEPAHLLQIWLLPNRTGVAPRYAQEAFTAEAKRNRLALLVSPDGREGSIATHQDALLYGTSPDDGQVVSRRLADSRQGYVHVARGRVRVNGAGLGAGDGARIGAGEQVSIEGVAGGGIRRHAARHAPAAVNLHRCPQGARLGWTRDAGDRGSASNSNSTRLDRGRAGRRRAAARRLWPAPSSMT